MKKEAKDIKFGVEPIRFRLQLLVWYHKNKRTLPWRDTCNPYFIWLSEIILQQTQVKQGLPYYLKFVRTYPTVEAIADAAEQDILRLWQGLGYYSRARNMHHTAQKVVAEMGGVFPQTYKQLLTLKGVGKYTAAAIASFAYGQVVPVIDGNVYRVLARIFGLQAQIDSTAGQRIFREKAEQLICPENPADYNQAIMEFGAICCTPKNPNCLYCPFTENCYANRTGTQSILPQKRPKQKAKNRFLHYFVLDSRQKLALKKRTKKGIWQGLYDFHCLEAAHKLPDEQIETHLKNRLNAQKTTIRTPPKSYQHLLTHQKLNVSFYHIILPNNPTYQLPDGLKFYSRSQIDKLPKPILIQKYLSETPAS